MLAAEHRSADRPKRRSTATLVSRDIGSAQRALVAAL
jgi:hypothetical protein